MTAIANLPPRVATHPGRSAPAPLDLRALVGMHGWSRLPRAVQRRFAAAHADTCYSGLLDLRCSPIGRVYAALGACLGGPLLGRNADSVPTTVRVRGDGHGGVRWERRFTGPDRQIGHSVCSTKELDSHGRLMERTAGGLSMSLDVYEEAGALVFRSRRYWLVRAGLRIPVPMLLTPGVCRVAHTDLGGGTFRFTLSMDHPLWGQTFSQSGEFADPGERELEGAAS